jgi:hypothetical protein
MYNVDSSLDEYWVVEFSDGEDSDHIDKNMANALRYNMEFSDSGIVELRCLSGAVKTIRMSTVRDVFYSTPAIREQYRTIQHLLSKEYKEFKRANSILDED